MRFISKDEINQLLDWPTAIRVVREGHVQMSDCHLENSLLQKPDRFVLTRTANIPEFATGVKVAVMMPGKTKRTPPQATEDAVFILIDDKNWNINCILDGVAVTSWKTPADSALGSSILSKPDAQTMLMIGAGHLASHLVQAHLCARPKIDSVLIWNRTHDKAIKLAQLLSKTSGKVAFKAVTDVAQAAATADIISCATNSVEPVLRGEWIQAGTHIDLVGAFAANMREVDDAMISSASLFVNCFATAAQHCGDLVIPINTGTISRNDIQAELTQMVHWTEYKRAEDEITIYKNGGGGHIDMMIAQHVYNALNSES